MPTFASIEEAAEFFDTHDSVDFADEWEEAVDVRFEAAEPHGAFGSASTTKRSRN